MATLIENLGAPNKRPSVVAECVRLVDDEVASKGGISGIAVKTGYRVIKGLKPGFVSDAVDALLDDFCTRLQPLVDEAKAQGKPIGAYFLRERSRVAEALLAITDERAQHSKHAAVKGAYEKLRGLAKRNVEDAVPRIAALLDRQAV
jgi:hypothetical protein